MKIKTRCVFTVPRLHSSSLEFHPFSFLRLVSLSLLHCSRTSTDTRAYSLYRKF